MSYAKILLAANKGPNGGSSGGGPAATDVDFSMVTTLIHGNGNNGATNNQYTAQDNLIFNQTGNVGEGTFSPYGSAFSAYFAGGGTNLSFGTSTAFGFGTGAFTIEAWVNLTSYNTNNAEIVDLRASVSSGATALAIDSTGHPYYYDGPNNTTYAATNPVAIGTWNHIAVCRTAGGVWTLYVNGISVVTSTSSDSLGTSQPCLVGQAINGTSYGLNGYISNLRIVTGSAVYTANFTPPTAPLTAIAGTSLLICNNARFIDQSTNAFVPTVNGTPALSRFNPFGDNALGYSASSIGGSTWFDGSTGYLTGPTNNMAFGTGNFTVEFWAYPASSSATTYMVDTRTSATSTGWSAGTGLDTAGKWGWCNNGTIVTEGGNVTTNEWSHFAYCRSGTTGYLFVNGALVNTVTDNTTYVAGATLTIGSHYTNTLFYGGYITDLRVTNSALYTAAFTPNTVPLTSVTGTVLLMNSTDTAVSGAYDVAMQQNVVQTGDVVISNAQSKFGGTSLYFDAGASTALTVPLTEIPTWGTANWTIETWLYPLSVSSYGFFLQQRTGTSAIGPFAFCILNGELELVVSNNSSGWAVNIVGGTISANTWSHVAAVRNGTTVTVYLNGVSIGTGSLTGAMSPNTYNLLIGSALSSGYNFNGYMQDIRITTGIARYTSTFTPPTAALPNSISTDPYFNYVSLLIHGTGTNGFQNKAFTSPAANLALTANGTLAEGTFTPYGSNWSTFLSSTSTASYLTYGASTSASPANATFTIEAWVCFDTLPTTATSTGAFYIWQKGRTGASNFEMDLALAYITTGTYALQYQVSADGATITTVTSSNITTLTTGTWNHIAITQVGGSGVVNYWLNGVSLGTSTHGITSVYAGTGAASIGNNNAGSNPVWQGYVSNIRVVFGSQVYTSAFTPGTTPLGAITGTNFLGCQSNRFIDNSANAWAITSTGPTEIVRFNPFGDNATPYTAATYGGACWFDGSTGYLNNANAAMISGCAFGTNNFTIEAWVYPVSSTGVILDTRTTASANGLVLWLNAGVLTVAYGTSSSTVASGTVLVDAWSHIAYCRSITTGYLFINGKLITTVTDSTSVAASAFTVGVVSSAASNFFSGYITDLRITNGTALYTTAFTPPTAPLTKATGTAFLFNGIDDGSGGIFDNAMQQGITTYGALAVSTTEQLWGTGSLYFNGVASCYATIANTQLPPWGANNWTIEFWVYPIASTQTIYLLSHKANSSVQNGPLAIWLNGGVLSFVASANGSSYTTSIGGTTAIPTGTWTHIAAVRNGTTITLYQGGVSVASGSIGTLTPATAPLTIGSAGAGSGYTFDGYMQDFRITYGLARYLANFTPPTAAFPNQ